jgi:hypothetical protein
MNTPIRLTLALALAATTLTACASSTDDADEATGQVRQAAKCTTCGGDPEPEPEGPPPPPPVQGPTIQCSGGSLEIVGGRCYNVKRYSCCPGGFTVISQYYCPLAYPVQRCSALTGTCTCWTY